MKLKKMPLSDSGAQGHNIRDTEIAFDVEGLEESIQLINKARYHAAELQKTINKVNELRIKLNIID